MEMYTSENECMAPSHILTLETFNSQISSISILPIRGIDTSVFGPISNRHEICKNKGRSHSILCTWVQ